MCVNISSEPYHLNQSARQEMQKSSIKLLMSDGFVKQPWSKTFIYTCQDSLLCSLLSKLLQRKQEIHIYFPSNTEVRRVSFTKNNTIDFVYNFSKLYCLCEPVKRYIFWGAIRFSSMVFEYMWDIWICNFEDALNWRINFKGVLVLECLRFRQPRWTLHNSWGVFDEKLP